MRAALAVLLALGACSDLQTEGDYVFLRNAGADLPILITGNTASRTLIVWLSSGPGDPIAVQRGLGTALLEERYGMVYWDQRGCGSAQGNAPPETFTVTQFVDDTDKVIDLVRARYAPDRIFLAGHSWGGTLGSAYLLAHQDKVAGFIDIAGNHDIPLIYPMKLAWLERHAAAQVAAGVDVAHWQPIQAWTSSHPPLTVANLDRWDRDLDGTHADFYNRDAGFNVGFDMIFRSPESAFAYLVVNRDYISESLYRDDSVLATLAYAQRLHEITVPALLLWGRHDGIVPLPAGEDALARLGGPKQLVVLEGSAHFPFLEEPGAFAAAVTAFVDGNRR
jgi:proline iminopeptidase